jgi:hypothetical protein
MAQTSDVQATSAVGASRLAQAENPAPGGGFGNPMTILLLVVAGALFWWSMRRSRRMEERMRERRHYETTVAAEESARNVAHLMRSAPSPGAADAAAREGLASAARMPAAPSGMPTGPASSGATSGEATTGNGAQGTMPEEAHARVIERSEAAAEAERAAAEEARRAASRAELSGESEARRLAAAEAAAAESRADTVDATGAGDVGAGDVREMAGVTGDALFDAAEAREAGGPRTPTGESLASVDAAAAAAEHAQVTFNDSGVVAEAQANEADALRGGVPGAVRPATPDEKEALRQGLRELENEPEVPMGAILGDGTHVCPPDFPVKGNAQSMIYHEPGQSSYPPTIAEFCFASAEAAEAAGYRQSRARGQRSHE